MGIRTELKAELQRKNERLADLHDEVKCLTALCDGYSGEIERMTTENSALKILHDECAAESVANGAEVERLNGIVTALEEGCHSCQHPNRVDELTCQKNALQQVLAERDAEIERLASELKHSTRRYSIAESVLKAGVEGLWELADYRDRNCMLESWLRDSIQSPVNIQSALTRARAEGMEEAAKIVDKWVGCSGIALIIRDAAKGEQ